MDKIIYNKVKQSKIARDLGRKLCHFLFLLIIYYAGYFTARFTLERLPHLAYDINFSIWGISSVFRVDPALWYWQMPTMQTIQVMVFFVSHVIAWYVDLLKNSKKFWFVGRNTIIRFLKEKELNEIGSYSPFLAGLTFSAFILPPFPVFAIAWVMIVADTAASQIGMRWGKHKLWWNGKSIEGVIAGAIASFGTIIFIGPLWAIISCIVYIIIDLSTEKPIPITDNLAFPLALTIIYYLLGESGLLYSVIPFLL
jgi:dolichol kinase